MAVRGVVTTGIYCRAGCAARPLERHLRRFDSPIAAQAAGFRPCLVCRPDRVPGRAVEQPAAEVEHALRLIAEGFLDSSNTDALAARIGYSTRQLTRLFERHVGASPDFVARSRRAHLARRLLDESDLTITHVAFASGFQSLRQMNRSMRALFGFSPSELRSKRRRGDRLDPLDGGIRLRVPHAGAFDAQRTLRHLGARTIVGVEAVEAGVYRRVIVTCGFPGVIEARPSTEGDHLEVTMHLATLGSIVDEVERVRSLFRLDDDPSHAEQTLRRDRALGRLVRRCPGTRLPGAWDRFETSIRIIVGQQVSVASASTLAGRIAERYGTAFDIELPGRLAYAFPTADQLADADLARIGIPRARATSIRAFSAAVAGGELDLSEPASLEDASRTLESIPGIGPWTSQLIAARAMGHADAFAAGDLGLRRAAAALLGKREPLSQKSLESLAEGWRPHRSAAMAYLWMASPEELRQPVRKRQPTGIGREMR